MGKFLNIKKPKQKLTTFRFHQKLKCSKLNFPLYSAVWNALMLTAESISARYPASDIAKPVKTPLSLRNVPMDCP